jgi:hypothetical protein
MTPPEQRAHFLHGDRDPPGDELLETGRERRSECTRHRRRRPELALERTSETGQADRESTYSGL